MAPQTSIPQLINRAFAGNAAADIEQRAARQAKVTSDALESKMRAEFDTKLAQKVDVQAFADYTESANTGDAVATPTGEVNVTDTGDGFLTIG